MLPLTVLFMLLLIKAMYSWNKDLTRQRAVYMGNEARKKGVNVLLGPVIGPVGRVVQGGRNWECESIREGTLIKASRHELTHQCSFLSRSISFWRSRI